MSSVHTLGLNFRLNGRLVSVVMSGALITLLDLLRNDLDVVGAKAGCRTGDCGTCTVLVEGHALKSCLVPAQRVEGLEVVTLEGLGERLELSQLQQIFWDENAFQCGFCLAGHLLCLAELQRDATEVTEHDIVLALKGNLCRCTGYQRIMAAALRAFGLAGADSTEAYREVGAGASEG